MFRRLLSSMTKKSSSYSSSSSIQDLYDLCKITFTPTGKPPPTSQAIHKICSLLDVVGPADVGLKEENQEDDRGHGYFSRSLFNRLDRWAQPITYVDIHECSSFTMCIFCFPTSAVIPLHDHPGMTVFSKLLFGSLHVKAYDWVEPPCYKESRGTVNTPVRLAKLASDKVLTAPCAASVLFPKTGGNLHCFTALTPCSILDILAPPYQEAAGRKCTYYNDYPYSSFSGGNEDDDIRDLNDEYAWLAEISLPEDLDMRQGIYEGPSIRT